jgi:AcrR family transcriptional regulator
MDSRTRLLIAAAAVYAEAGFRGTTTRRIAEVAELNEITLFRHFGSKDTLVKAALQRLYQQENPIVLAEPVDPPRELRDWAITTMRHFGQGRNVIFRVMGDLVEHPELAPDICAEPASHHRMLSNYLRRMQELGLTTTEFIPDAAAGLLLGSVFSHGLWRADFATPDLPPMEVIVDNYVQLLLNAVGYRSAAGKTRKERA